MAGGGGAAMCLGLLPWRCRASGGRQLWREVWREVGGRRRCWIGDRKEDCSTFFEQVVVDESYCSYKHVVQ